MKNTIILSTASLLLAGTGIAWAQSDIDQTPFQLSLVPQVALYSHNTEVQGFSLGVWSENPQESLTMGLVNGSTGDSGGLSIGVVTYAETYHGVEWSLFNYTRDEFMGWQSAVVNVDMGKFIGFQDGAVNVVQQEATGLQLGVVNYAGSLRGVQLGVVNIACNNPWFDELPNKLATGFPILNWSF